MDDFNRNVYCVCGLPIDALDMNNAISQLRNAKFKNKSCFLSTPNINFVSITEKDPSFLQSVIHSDIVVADGTPIVWVSGLLGIPIKHRIAGSSLFEFMSKESRRKMNVYFMGGVDGVAEAACHQLNKTSKALTCVGYYSPGFGNIDEMSTENIIAKINESRADFLVVALGAKKGQAWILKNLNKITIPLKSHLGAVINFEAQILKRAPLFIQELGFEWLWRIKEEPSLWRRYFKDGLFFSRILVTHIFPLAIWLKLNKSRIMSLADESSVSVSREADTIVIKVKGVVQDPVSDEVRAMLRQISTENKNIHVDFSQTFYVGFGFLALLLLLKKHLDKTGFHLKLIKLSRQMNRVVRWNMLNYLKG